jgi:hypothetical protein
MQTNGVMRIGERESEVLADNMLLLMTYWIPFAEVRGDPGRAGKHAAGRQRDHDAGIPECVHCAGDRLIGQITEVCSRIDQGAVDVQGDEAYVHSGGSSCASAKELLINSRLLSPHNGVCGEATSAANVEYIGKEGNDDHRPCCVSPSGVYRACPGCVARLANVLDIACGARLTRTGAISSELS